MKLLIGKSSSVVMFMVLAASLSQANETGSGQTGKQNVQPAPTAVPAPKSNANINKGSGKAAAGELIGAGMNAAAAAMFASRCGSSDKTSCVLAAIHAAQTGQMLAAKKGADKTKSATDFRYDYKPTDYDYNQDGIIDHRDVDPDSESTAGNGDKQLEAAGINPAAIQKQIGEVNKSLRDKGVALVKDGKAVRLADGKEVSTAAMGSAAGMAGAGFSQADIAKAEASKKEVSEKIASKFKVIPMDSEGGGGGGSGGGRAMAGSDDGLGDYKGFDPRSMFGAMGAKDKAASAPNVAGMEKRLGNESIGVAADNIFDMVHRRYKAKSSQNAFME